MTNSGILGRGLQRVLYNFSFFFKCCTHSLNLCVALVSFCDLSYIVIFLPINFKCQHYVNVTENKLNLDFLSYWFSKLGL